MALKTISIEDFSGGKNLFNDQVLIGPNECASGSQNVWAPNNLLTKIPGYTIFASFTATASGGHALLIADDNIKPASFQLYHYLQSSLTNTASNSNYFPWGGETDSLTPLGYVTGTVSVSGASLISATGNGTSWTTHIVAGDLFRSDATASAWFKVSSIEDNTHLTLANALPAAMATGSAYTIMPAASLQPMAGLSFIGSLWACSTADTMQRYDSTGMTRIAAAPKVAFLAIYKNYLFGARSNTAESRLYWSAIKDPTTWPTNNFVDIQRDQGKITGIFPIGNELLIFKTRSMHKFVASDAIDPSNPTYYVYPITVPNHFIFNNGLTPALLNGRCVFFGGGRIYSFIPGTFFITDISQKFFLDFPTLTGSIFNYNSDDQAYRGYQFNKYYVIKGFQYGGAASRVFGGILDHNGAWWLVNEDSQPGTSPGCFDQQPMTVLASTSQYPRLIMAGTANQPRLYVYDLIGPSFQSNFISNTTGANISINGIWISKEFNVEYGVFKWIVVYLKKQTAGTLTVSWSIDQAAYVSSSVDMTIGRGKIIRSVLPINQKGTSIQLKLQNNVAGQTFQVYGIKIIYEESAMERLL